MIKVVVVAQKFEHSVELEKYAQKKLDGLEKYIPKSVRRSAHVEVRFKQTHAKDKKQNTCELTLHLPHENLFAHETTLHMYAALDIAAAHIQQQLVAYKAKHGTAWRQRIKHVFGAGDYTA